MKRIILFILTIPLFLCTRAQSTIVACEYWMDGDMDAITEVPVSGNEASFSIDVSSLADGMHTLRMSAAEYVLDGITTVSEMLRVSFEE